MLTNLFISNVYITYCNICLLKFQFDSTLKTALQKHIIKYVPGIFKLNLFKIEIYPIVF